MPSIVRGLEEAKESECSRESLDKSQESDDNNDKTCRAFLARIKTKSLVIQDRDLVNKLKGNRTVEVMQKIKNKQKLKDRLIDKLVEARQGGKKKRRRFQNQTTGSLLEYKA